MQKVNAYDYGKNPEKKQLLFNNFKDEIDKTAKKIELYRRRLEKYKAEKEKSIKTGKISAAAMYRETSRNIFEGISTLLPLKFSNKEDNNSNNGPKKLRNEIPEVNESENGENSYSGSNSIEDLKNHLNTIYKNSDSRIFSPLAITGCM